MEPLLLVASAAVGYLCGSISNARIITRITSPGTDISKIEYKVPQYDEVFTSDSVSASAARMHLGVKWGVLTAILDMAKVAIPTLAFKLWQPDTPYYLVVAAFGLVGHDWPIFFRFQGGRGESPIYGGLIVIDWLGALLMNLLGFLVGFVLRNLLVLRWAGLVLLIPWIWLRTGSLPHLAYIVFVNLVYWYAMSPELKEYFELGKKDINPSQEEIAEFLGMGAKLGHTLDTYSWWSLIGRKRSGGEKEQSEGQG